MTSCMWINTYSGSEFVHEDVSGFPKALWHSGLQCGKNEHSGDYSKVDTYYYHVRLFASMNLKVLGIFRHKCNFQ